jgi:hypothetical protein
MPSFRGVVIASSATTREGGDAGRQDAERVQGDDAADKDTDEVRTFPNSAEQRDNRHRQDARHGPINGQEEHENVHAVILAAQRFAHEFVGLERAFLVVGSLNLKGRSADVLKLDGLPFLADSGDQFAQKLIGLSGQLQKLFTAFACLLLKVHAEFRPAVASRHAHKGVEHEETDAAEKNPPNGVFHLMPQVDAWPIRRTTSSMQKHSAKKKLPRDVNALHRRGLCAESRVCPRSHALAYKFEGRKAQRKRLTQSSGAYT